MSAVWDRGGDIPLEHAKFHYFTIRKFIQGAITMVVPIEPLKRIAAETGVTQYANPYLWAIKGIINGTAQYQRDWGVTQPIDFIFDERGEEAQVQNAWDFYTETIPLAERSITGKRPSFQNDENVLPLQAAADMWAWWNRRQWLEKRTVMHDEFPIPWGQPDDFPTLSLELTEVEIREEFNKIQIVLDKLREVRF
jgi:hypothetical protein